jgi:hypothetical protein
MSLVLAVKLKAKGLAECRQRLARNVIFARANCLSGTFVIFRFDPSMANEKAGRSPSSQTHRQPPEASQEHQAVPLARLWHSEIAS